MADVPDGFKDPEDSGKKVFGDGFLQPLGPLAHIFRIGRPRHAGGDVFVSTGELEGELGDINSLVLAEFRGFTRGVLHFFWFLEPVGKRGGGEQAGGEGCGIHDADAPFLEHRDQAGKHRVLEV